MPESPADAAPDSAAAPDSPTVPASLDAAPALPTGPAVPADPAIPAGEPGSTGPTAPAPENPGNPNGRPDGHVPAGPALPSGRFDGGSDAVPGDPASGDVAPGITVPAAPTAPAASTFPAGSAAPAAPAPPADRPAGAQPRAEFPPRALPRRLGTRPVAPAPAPPGAQPPQPLSVELLAGVFGLLAIVFAVLLPFAPVKVNSPTVSWPVSQGTVQPTLLPLTAYRPLTLDVRFTCDAVRAAAATPERTVFATMTPTLWEAGQSGLVVTAPGNHVRVTAAGLLLLDEEVPAGDCEYAVHADGAKTQLSLDRVPVATSFDAQVPDVDMLTTSLTSLSSPGDLAVTLLLDDEFASSPTPAKTFLTWLAGLCALASGCCLLVIDRRTRRVPAVWRILPPAVVDLVVPAVMVLWLFLSPSTDDDGYYAAMARNFRASGFVGNYYQLYDQSFTPFTWFYHLLSWWQTVAGDSVPAQRVPALVFGLIAWFAVRRFVAALMRGWAAQRPGLERWSRAALALSFLTWWLPLDMGVRPESAVMVGGALALVWVATAVRRTRLAVLWLALLAAAAGFAVHPTGFTAFAPIVAGLPALSRLIRGEHWKSTAWRAVAVGSAVAAASILAFADGAYRDFLRGQETFLAIQEQEDWTAEFVRYNWLLSDIAMGSFAKRAAVLVTLVALLWFAVLVAAAKARRVNVPWPFFFAGCSTALAFLLLLPTPSKWTHHFGALSGITSVFLALMLVMALPLVREVAGRLPVPLLLAVATSFVLALALAGDGPNDWPYTWLIGVPNAKEAPPFGTLLWWVLAFVIIAAVLGGLVALGKTRNARITVLHTVPVLVVVGLLTNVIYLVGGFGIAAATPGWSFWGDNLRDPAATQCGAAQAVRVLDPARATPLSLVAGTGTSSSSTSGTAAGTDSETASEEGSGTGSSSAGGSRTTSSAAGGFVAGGGVPEGAMPPLPAGSGMASAVWGSFVARESQSPERTTGEITTGWWRLPAPRAGSEVAVLATGTLGQGNELVAEYGRQTSGGIVAVGRAALADQISDTTWRTFVLPSVGGADVVRLHAVDQSGGIGGWLAFGAPSVAPRVPLLDVIPPDQAPTAVAWQVSFQFPCLRLPRVADGITEPVHSAVLWSDQQLSGYSDGTWQPFRGGLFGQVRRTGPALQLSTTVEGVDPSDWNLQTYLFAPPLPAGQYVLTRGERWTAGFDTSTGTPARAGEPKRPG